MRREADRAGKALPRTLCKQGENQVETVERAPDYERPVGAVSQPAQQERNEQVVIPTWLCDTVSAERDVHVIAEPR